MQLTLPIEEPRDSQNDREVREGRDFSGSLD